MSEFLKALGAIVGGAGVVMGVITGFQTQEAASYLEVEGVFLYTTTIIYIVSGIVSGSVLYALGSILETVQDTNSKISNMMKVQSEPLAAPTNEVE